jgi:hypothetical protein
VQSVNDNSVWAACIGHSRFHDKQSTIVPSICHITSVDKHSFHICFRKLDTLTHLAITGFTLYQAVDRPTLSTVPNRQMLLAFDVLITVKQELSIVVKLKLALDQEEEKFSIGLAVEIPKLTG